MARSLGLLASLASLAALASAETTVKLLVLGDESPFVGSVVKADPSVTTVLVKCLHETSDSCGLPPGAVASDTNSMGPTASAGSGSQPSKTAASVGTGSGSQPSKTAASVGTGSENQPSKTAAGVGTGSENQPSKTTSGTASQATASSASASASASASTSTSTSSKGTNAAGPAVTQNAVLAGVAAVVGGVLAL
ncbi:hypothetical protein UVI_02057950 [Ustilaginoidea virens]|uniref:GPI anchored protein n=1 Tax=Ustilaginoidea virens TaxID=1159556 RepID=A0A1B5L0A3_USTVR|nr:hypothetical protein UVI_02057950 [Ustilaginoidea virens]